ncbi:sulfite exporter TauE/SafE family protein [Herbidospora mongoliensis]|uniref:sulfite exporter TauE/SafE family protein n=1 Tax=Herbidospora mongoliensis TaxID=688067 RepID=UPI000A6DB607|nr:sulfite exporter TauE/SafE family protein [Herbidospora mongoliensis]
MEILVLALVGVATGIVSTVVSLASIVSYPALLAFGLPPLAANVTNTVSLTFTGVGSAVSSRPELKGQSPLVLRLLTATALGGATGAALLLLTPPRAFELVAPVLVAGASLVLLRAPRSAALHGPNLWIGVYVVSIYTGYFGAAGGVIMFAILSAALDQSPAHVNAVKNVIAMGSNGVAAIGFVLFGPVRWDVVVPLAIGMIVGGWIGPFIARRLPGQSLRILTAVAGLVVAVKLAFDTYT